MESYLTLLSRLAIVAFVAIIASYVITPVAQKAVAPLAIATDNATHDDSPDIQERPNNRTAIYAVICLAVFTIGSLIVLALQTRKLIAEHNHVLKLGGKIGYEPDIPTFFLKQFQCETSIDLCSTALNDSNLPNFPTFPRLKTLRVASTAISNQTAGIFSQCKNLRSLDVSETCINDEFIQKISGLPHLETILASGSQISDNCVESLAAVKALKKIECNNTEFTTVGAEKLNELNPKIIVRYAG